MESLIHDGVSVPGLNCHNLVADVVGITTMRPDKFWQSSALINLLPKERVVADFSSPNIAKPFHVGHLRSTIIGNFICNLHEAFGHEVTRINYLGDWGTQFGMLKYGIDACNMTENDLKDDAIRKLYEVYVWANQKAEEDPCVLVKAQEIFSKMEQGDEEVLKAWNLFRKVSIEDLISVYSRLNVKFDEYHGESMYSADECQESLEMMEGKGLLESLEDGRKVFCLTPNNKITVVKSDGSSIYLSRDIAGAVDRYKRYKFTKSYYVVDNAQTDHFIALFTILNQLGFDWAENMRHIKFGRIRGMSTRKGTAVFLQDLLDEAQKVMKQKQEETDTTREDLQYSSMDIADKIAVSCILVGDMKQRRQRDYIFSWDKVLQSRGDTGAKLQYVHCRLMNLQENCGIEFVHTVNTRFLTEPVAISLVCEIARFDEVLTETYRELEPCILVNYLFKLSGSINSALKQLQVKSSPLEIAKARLALFVAARFTLAAGMKILGLEPLNNM
ncbi:probable arginine--tRNA ligase, mitochondrial [Macrobrachium nipponense]|uniref:probable arginine--tRNA ligase, mitochondrial n=1 Tax=Macrobrachium nipponense TaxID=159736 RepID=UPI0030C7EA53